MSLACKCDRCKKYFEDPDTIVTRVNKKLFNLISPTTRYTGETEYDLCPSCSEALHIWLNEYNNVPPNVIKHDSTQKNYQPQENNGIMTPQELFQNAVKTYEEKKS